MGSREYADIEKKKLQEDREDYIIISLAIWNFSPDITRTKK
jgi:hypothetical protein